METNIKVVGKIDLSVFERKTKEKEVVEVKKYPQEEIHFFMDKGKKVVGRINSGKIAIISFDFKNNWVKNGEDWICNIVAEEEKKVIVMPVVRTKSAEDNYNDSVMLVSKLKEQGFKKEFTKTKNTVLYYQSK